MWVDVSILSERKKKLLSIIAVGLDKLSPDTIEAMIEVVNKQSNIVHKARHLVSIIDPNDIEADALLVGINEYNDKPRDDTIRSTSIETYIKILEDPHMGHLLVSDSPIMGYVDRLEFFVDCTDSGESVYLVYADMCFYEFVDLDILEDINDSKTRKFTMGYCITDIEDNKKMMVFKHAHYLKPQDRPDNWLNEPI